MKWFEENTFIRTEDGLRLETKITYDPEREIRGSVVLFSPHPLYGGDMDNNVLTALRDALPGLGFSVTSFNYRGVGQSESEDADIPTYEYWSTLKERKDYSPAILDGLAATAYAAQHGNNIRLVGYSLGGMVAAGVAERAPACLARLVAIATPLYEMDCSVLARVGSYQVILGGCDELVSRAEAAAAFQKIGGDGTLAVFDESDHFFIGQEERVANEVAAFIS